MARKRQRQRTTSYGRAAPPRQTSYQVGVFKGLGQTGRRSTITRRSLPRSVLPSLNPWAVSPRLYPGGLERRPVRPLVRVVGTRGTQSRRISTVSFRPRDLGLARNPELKTKITTPCQIRAQRKEIMFAHNVAGRKWGRGGPKMRGARKTVFSNYTCR